MGKQGQRSPASPQRPSEDPDRDSKRFQGEFDRILGLFIALGIVLTLSYGWTAGTCPPDPQQLPPPAAPTAQQGQEKAPDTRQPRTGQAGRTAGAPGNAAEEPGNTTEEPGNATEETGNTTAEPGNTIGANANTGRPPAAQARSVLHRPRCETGGSGFAGALLALAIALAALAIGTVIGFLFGLPRTLTSSDVREVQQQASGSNAAGGGGAQGAPSSTATPTTATAALASDVNTNLEKISDWLTTIIVGVGLTKLEDIPGALEGFGENVALYFGYGGKVFGIAGGLYFLIVGFFLAYVGTRVKLSLVFAFSRRANLGAGTPGAAVETSSSVSPLDTAALAPAVAGITTQVTTDVKNADAQMLRRNLTELNSPQELAAYAHAAARQGRPKLAADIFADLVRESPDDPTILGDYAGVLGLAGDPEGARRVVESLDRAAPGSQEEAQTKAYVGRLRGGLYNRNYKDSIAAGEELIKQQSYDRDPWIHVWLACAYGQRHRDLKAAGAGAGSAELEEARQLVLREVGRAVAIDPGLKTFIRTLYDPERVVGGDNDLASLHRDEELEKLLADMPTEQPAEQTAEQTAAEDAKGTGAQKPAEGTRPGEE